MAAEAARGGGVDDSSSEVEATDSEYGDESEVEFEPEPELVSTYTSALVPVQVVTKRQHKIQLPWCQKRGVNEHCT